MKKPETKKGHRQSRTYREDEQASLWVAQLLCSRTEILEEIRAGPESGSGKGEVAMLVEGSEAIQPACPAGWPQRSTTTDSYWHQLLTLGPSNLANGFLEWVLTLTRGLLLPSWPRRWCAMTSHVTTWDQTQPWTLAYLPPLPVPL